ncbi:GNAT family N-acetyltransferase [Paenibacillus methanolicus]|uniref:GNAT acetyltransferase-like protein n=1 Tax=Paenibacillus methanolicus TaxID=582686 RepID=A0A5S5BV91_9BACL|nr:GNAT family N-acetyltransferase [Paenibacillus methanolicus]TYP69523.1 GNAT acetyltransferase-like protein [Paenibacillus methanolicus]
MHNHLDLMRMQAEVLYIHDHAGRITTINEPANQPAPRLFWGQTEAGSIVRFRSDMPDGLVHDIEQIIGQTDSTERLAQVIRALERSGGIKGLWIGPAFACQEVITDCTDATLVTEDNRFCLEPGFPHLLSELTFREPCYMVTENNMALSVCFSARSSDKAAEAGVGTLQQYRGKGYAMRVTSAWAQAIQQTRRIPFYSTAWDNYASQSIAKRLRLHHYGTDISIY